MVSSFVLLSPHYCEAFIAIVVLTQSTCLCPSSPPFARLPFKMFTPRTCTASLDNDWSTTERGKKEDKRSMSLSRVTKYKKKQTCGYSCESVGLWNGVICKNRKSIMTPKEKNKSYCSGFGERNNSSTPQATITHAHILYVSSCLTKMAHKRG